MVVVADVLVREPNDNEDVPLVGFRKFVEFGRSFDTFNDQMQVVTFDEFADLPFEFCAVIVLGRSEATGLTAVLSEGSTPAEWALVFPSPAVSNAPVPNRSVRRSIRCRTRPLA